MTTTRKPRAKAPARGKTKAPGEKYPGYCPQTKGGGGLMRTEPCHCSRKPGHDEITHKCACGGEWDDSGRAVRPPMFPATANW